MRFFLCLLLLFTVSSSKAVVTVTNGTPAYNTNDNISSSLPSWSTGWGTGNTNTGWNYVGSIVAGGASGTYLGNGWVLTAAHVGPIGPFTLNGNVYDLTGVSYSNFTNSSTGTTNADLTLLQISTNSTTGTNLTLPSLTLTTNAPSGTVVMIGYGYTNGAGPESWGINTIALTNQLHETSGFASIDFLTPNTGSNYGTLILGDSGGGDFVNVGAGTNSAWALAGINEDVDASNSYFVQLSPYASQIQSIIAVPEPGTWVLMGLGMMTLLGSLLWRSRKRVSSGNALK